MLEYEGCFLSLVRAFFKNAKRIQIITFAKYYVISQKEVQSG